MVENNKGQKRLFCSFENVKTCIINEEVVFDRGTPILIYESVKQHA